MVKHRQAVRLKFTTHYSFQTQTSERLSPNTKLYCVETSAVINQGARSSAGLQTLHTLAINLPPQFIKTPAARCQSLLSPLKKINFSIERSTFLK